MPRRTTQFLPDNFYHIYNRGNNRQPVFLENRNFQFFLDKLHFCFDPSGIELVAFCLMPNHYHLIVRLQKEVDFSNTMRSFSLSYIKSINKAYHRVGHLFEGDYQARLIDAEEYLAHIIRYTHLNPVRAGLVQRPQDWDHSDYSRWISVNKAEYASIQKIRTDLFGSGIRYRRFVEDFADDQKSRIKMERLLFGKI